MKRYGAKYIQQIEENVERKSTILLLIFDNSDSARMETRTVDWRKDIPYDDFSGGINVINSSRIVAHIPKFAAQVMLLSGEFHELSPRQMWLKSNATTDELMQKQIPLRKEATE